MNKKKIIKVGFFLITLSFIISYIIEEAGYYEYQLQTKTKLTNEAIEQFEQDVKDNKEIDLNNYVVNSNIDYTNNVTNFTNKLSTKINKYLKKSIEDFFNVVGKAVEN